ncbi:unknow (plasmid) [Vibrio campbellii]|nr:unknow [Vibrio campbellii]
MNLAYKLLNKEKLIKNKQTIHLRFEKGNV